MYIVRNFYKGRPGYRCLQEAVRAHYLKHYQATPEPEPDLFVCLTDPNGGAPGYACAGISYGDSGKLFSEYYLDQSLDERYGLDRARIAEVGAFASFRSGSGAGKYLLNNVIKTLALRNFGLVVLTATEQVRQLLAPIVDNLEDLGGADRGRVRDPAVNWGSYYDHRPRVVVSRLSSPSIWMSAPAPGLAQPHFANQASA
ncbi:thermostable hemolysin [Pseudomonas putida]|uniref:Thermostable hemolysin n=1 Tax=Pseudomonas putida TaxID=303 RepID=A0A7Y7ZC84_PSEPU|nr:MULTISPECIES: thermostable hemolysin [Pseudomonas]KAF1309960.1 thermostable hemolysin [Pseudomonas sp. SG-MS2]NWC82210.1 thermostable hemolysin [Pseudomonas putida]